MLLANVPEGAVLRVAFITAILWEVVEWKKHVKETLSNRVLDIFVGVAGCALGFMYLQSFDFPVHTNAIVLTCEMLILALLGAVGWRNYGLYSKSKP